MREFKFRTWHKELNKMFQNENLRERAEYLAGLSDSICLVFGEKTINMQYTEVKDVNGVEIYEGDIVKAEWECLGIENSFEGTVVFDNNCWTVINYEEDANVEFEYIDKFLVLGNVFEGKKDE